MKISSGDHDLMALEYQGLEIARLNEALLTYGIIDRDLRIKICEKYFFHSHHFLDAGWFTLEEKKIHPQLCFVEQKQDSETEERQVLHVPSPKFRLGNSVFEGVFWYFEEQEEDISEIEIGWFQPDKTVTERLNDSVEPNDKTEPLSIPPLPPLRWKEYRWVGPVVLPAWAGFRVPRRPWSSINPPPSSDGTVMLEIQVLNGASNPPTAMQMSAYQYLLDHQIDLRDAILQEIFAQYPQEKRAFGYTGQEAEEYMPDLYRAEQLKWLIGLSTVHILHDGKDDAPYIGFEFKCSWEPEHDLGVMTRRGRVVAVGDAETSFTAWIAEREIN